MNHGKKMVAPIIVTVLLVLYYIGIIVLCMKMPMAGWEKFLLIAVPLLISVTLIAVLVGRIKEIKGGEEDDLSKY